MMVWVNFLPWRHRQRRMQRLRALLLPGLIALLPVSVFLQATGQRTLNDRYQRVLVEWQTASKQLGELNARAATLTLQKQKLQQVMRSRQAQQQKMQAWYLFARDLADQMPETLWLSEIRQNAAGLSLKGFSKGMRELHDFRQRLQDLPFFLTVKMEKVNLDAQYGLRFTLTGSLRTEGGSDD